MPNRFRLISHNGGRFTRRTVELSTVEIPQVPGTKIGCMYETCVFTGSDSEVLERYDRLVDAIEGHARWCSKMGLKV